MDSFVYLAGELVVLVGEWVLLGGDNFLVRPTKLCAKLVFGQLAVVVLQVVLEQKDHAVGQLTLHIPWFSGQLLLWAKDLELTGLASPLNLHAQCALQDVHHNLLLLMTCLGR